MLQLDTSETATFVVVVFVTVAHRVVVVFSCSCRLARSIGKLFWFYLVFNYYCTI